MEHTHQHFGLFGAWIEEPLEGLLERAGLSESLTHFLTHSLTDFLEIAVLLLVVVAAVSYLQTYIPYDRMKDKLKRLRGLPGYVLALALGMLSPFCSCSIIPIMMGFLVSGVPLSFCLAFLTSASCLNLTALSAIFARFDLKFAVLYAVCGLVICVVNAAVLGPTGEQLVRLDKLLAVHHHHHDENTVGSRLNKALCSAGLTFRNVWLLLLIGVLVSSAIAVFVPQQWIEAALSGNALALPLATLIGGCLHSDVFSVLPIVQTAYAYSPAVALTFLLATMLFSIAEWALLSQAFRGKLIARYCALLLALALLSGVAALFLL